MKRSVLQTMIVNAAIAGSAILSAIMLGRLLGPEGRGQYAAILIWPNLISMVLGIGIVDALVYHRANKGDTPQTVGGTMMWLVIAQSAAIAAVGYVLSPIVLDGYGSEAVFLSRVMFALSPISLFTRYVVGLTQGSLDFVRFNIFRLVIPIGTPIGILLLYLAGHLSVANVFWGLVFLNILVFLLAAFWYWSAGGSFWPGLNREKMRSLAGFGVRSQATSISSQLNLQIDQPIISLLTSASQLGIYTAAVSAANVTQFFAQAVNMVMLPSIAQSNDREAQIRRIERTFRTFWTLSIPPTLALGLLIPVAIPAVFGPEFVDAVAPAELLLVASLMLGAKGVLSAGATALGQPLIASKAEIQALVCNVVLVVVLVSAFGLVGAALASIVAYSLALGFLMRAMQSRFGLQLGKLFVPDFRLALQHAPLPRRSYR